MRLKNLILCLLLCIASASAKDVITKTDGTKLDAKVEEITETLIKYRKASNPIGPIYSIAKESVAAIQYENGEVEDFNTATTIQQYATGISDTLSDDDLIRMSGEQEVSSSSSGVSDVELLKIASFTPVDELMNKAKKYRKIGWYGAGGFLIAGLAAGFFTVAAVDNYVTLPIGAVVGVGAGAIWYYHYNRKANFLMNQAVEMQSYTSTILENVIVQLGVNSLTAGVNVMGNRMVNSHSLGLSLGLNF